jgi:hypothetical protein
VSGGSSNFKGRLGVQYVRPPSISRWHWATHELPKRKFINWKLRTGLLAVGQQRPNWEPQPTTQLARLYLWWSERRWVSIKSS